MCWNKGRLYWKIAKLFYFCHLKELVRPGTFWPTLVRTYHTDRLLSPLRLLLRTYMDKSALFWDVTHRRLIFLPTFRYILSVPSWKIKSSWTTWPVKMGLIGCSIPFVANYQSTLRNIPDERRPHLHRGRSLKSVNVTRGFFRRKQSRQGVKPTARNDVRVILTLNIPSLARQRCLGPHGFFVISQLFDAVDYSNYVFWVSETIIQWFKHC